MSFYTERLKRMQGAVDEQMRDYIPGGFTLLPPGEYEARAQAALGETRSDPKRLQVMWTFTVAEGEKIGRKVFDFNILEGGKDDGKTAKSICRGRIEDMGYEWPEKIVGLESVLTQITNDTPLVKIRVTHEENTGKKDGKKYINARVRVIDVGSTPDETPPDDTATAPDVPPSDDPTLDALLLLCNSYQLLYIKDDMDVDSIVTALRDNGASFRAEDLNADETGVLETVAEDLIVKPEPPKPKRTLAQAPAKTTKPATKARGRR